MKLLAIEEVCCCATACIHECVGRAVVTPSSQCLPPSLLPLTGAIPFQHQFLTVANDNSIALWDLKDTEEDGRFVLSCEKRYTLSTDA